MTISRVVQIAKLYPSNIEDLTKTFRSGRFVHKPYGMSRENSLERQIQELVEEVETGLEIRDTDRKYGPYSKDLDDRVDAVNTATTVLTGDPSRQVPEDIRDIQLAHFYDPEANSQIFSYGLMSHVRDNAVPDGPEFAVLLPYEKEADAPALVLSNNVTDSHAATLGLIVKALAYARENSAK